MSNLESLVETIAKKKDLVAQERDLPEINNPNVVRQKLGHIKRAKEDLKQLFYDYRKEVQNRAAFIIVTGDKAEGFVKTTEKGFGCYGVDAEILFKEIGKQIPTPIYLNKSSSPALFDYFAAKFGDRALDIDIIGHPHLGFESKYNKVLKSEEDMVNLMKKAFNEKVGAEVIGLDAIDRVAERAVNDGYAGKTVPIVLHTQDEELIIELSKTLKKLTGNIFIVSAGKVASKKIQNAFIAQIKSVNKKSVETVLKTIKENLL